MLARINSESLRTALSSRLTSTGQVRGRHCGQPVV